MVPCDWVHIPVRIEEGTLAKEIYGKPLISERHRHRYEFNNAYLQQFEDAGMIASGKNPESGLVEIIELPESSFFYRCTISSGIKKFG